MNEVVAFAGIYSEQRKEKRCHIPENGPKEQPGNVDVVLSVLTEEGIEKGLHSSGSCRVQPLNGEEKKNTMMPLQNAAYRFCLAALPVFALVSLLTGCDIREGSTPSPTALVTTSVPTLVGSPKGPGGVNVTPGTASSCSISNEASASTKGWNKYKDSHFPFQFAFPPGWRAGSFTDDSGNDYIVQVFPPGSTTPFGQAGLADQEHITITIALLGPTSTYANDPNWQAEAGSITISGVRSTLYDRTTPDCGEVNRGTTIDIGQHHFTFFMISVPEKAKQDIALFLGVLQSFTYTQ